jgi:hypothetical protein
MQLITNIKAMQTFEVIYRKFKEVVRNKVERCPSHICGIINKQTVTALTVQI